jgi:hypothetical protein
MVRVHVWRPTLSLERRGSVTLDVEMSFHSLQSSDYELTSGRTVGQAQDSSSGDATAVLGPSWVPTLLAYREEESRNGN